EQGHVKRRKARHEAPERLEDRSQFLRLALGQHIAETWLSAQLLDRFGLNTLADQRLHNMQQRARKIRASCKAIFPEIGAGKIMGSLRTGLNPGPVRADVIHRINK